MTYENIAFNLTRLLIFVAFIWLIRQHLFCIAVPSGSMLPLIRPGDRLLVRRLFSLKRLKRGDLVVFRSTASQKGDGTLLMIKRLIGLPGDKVELKAGKISLNGEEQAEPYVVFQKNVQADFSVRSGSCLFLGDNRSASYDARYWAEPYVREREIAGRAVMIIWPLNRIRFLK